MKTDTYVTIEKLIPAPPPAVFQAWLDPQALARFMCPATGASISKTQTDPRVGGRFLIVMHVGDRDLPHRGEYRLIEPHRRLEFTWDSHMAPPDSLVAITFDEAGAGQTLLKLVHGGLPTDRARDSHDQGWTLILDNLAAMTATGAIRAAL